MDIRDGGAEHASLLLLEDDWDHRNVFRDFLQHRGWTVREATQASSARALLASERIDVLVVDLGGTNGWSLLEEMGTRSARPRLLCLTGDARRESRERAVALGADQYMVKPVPLQQLADAVERLRSATSGVVPAAAKPPDAPPRRGSARPPSARRRRRARSDRSAPRARPIVLLLEDDDDARVIYRDMLDFAGYEVLAARDGLEGLRYAETCTPDIVVTDLHMPGMNGLEVARTLREDVGTTAAIIAVTADSLGVDAARKAEGSTLFDEVLVKPVSPGELVRTVRAYVPAPADEPG